MDKTLPEFTGYRSMKITHGGRCGVPYMHHPQPPDTNMWMCPDIVVKFLIALTRCK